MEKFLKENWFKMIISLVLVFVAGSVAYYFVIYLPNKDKTVIRQQSLNVTHGNAQNCAEIGQEYFDKNFSEYKNGFPTVTLDGPFFHYSEKLQACLLEYKLTIYNSSILADSKNYRVDNYIINLLNGETTFVTYSWKNDGFANDYDLSEYERFANLEMELMQN
jgi:hypothetical protein